MSVRTEGIFFSLKQTVIIEVHFLPEIDSMDLRVQQVQTLVEKLTNYE